MKNLPIIVKFLSVLALLAIVSVLAIGYMAFQLRQATIEGARIAQTSMQAAIDIANSKEEIERARGNVLSVMFTSKEAKKQSFLQQMNIALAHYNQHMSKAEILVPHYAEQINSLHQQGIQVFTQVCAKAIQMGKTSTTETDDVAAQTEALNDGCLDGFVHYADTLSNLRNRMITDTAQEYAQLQNQKMHLLLASVLALLLAIIVVGIISFLVVTKYITQPLGRLRTAMQHLSSGDLAVSVPETDRLDEVGKMAKTVLLFQESGLEKQRMEQAAQQAQVEIEAAHRRSEAARAEAEAAATQEVVVASLANGLGRLSTGDLVFRITDHFALDYEKLRIDFNRAMDTLQQTMQNIAQNAIAVDSSAKEITQGADDMSRRTEQQAASLEQTAAALDEITATVKKSTEGMREVHSRVNEAKEDAERSAAVVDETVKAMGGIKESSEKISNIIGIIDEIAFQTNLLALNAGVEAARAGDAGRGFAVVATEVRALAQRSAGAAKEIKSLISASGTQVQTGVKLVSETGQALGRIVEQVARLNILITDITNSSVEQSTALGEVNTAINQMDQTTQQNAAMVEQNTAASHALASEAEELKKLVGQFRIDIKTGTARQAA